jgi:hypothetical protein
MRNNQTSKYFIDAGLAALFMAAFFSDQTGMSWHQWIGVTTGVLAAWHLVTHWQWVCTVTKRFLGKTSGQARGYYLLDAGIFTGFMVTGVTGLAISTWANLSLNLYSLWVDVHVWASILTLALTGVKLAMHWRWISASTRRLFSRPVQAPRSVLTEQRAVPVAATMRSGSQMSRRDFIKVIGIVGAASYLAVRSAAAGLSTAAGNNQADTASEVAGSPSSENTTSGYTSRGYTSTSGTGTASDGTGSLQSFSSSPSGSVSASQVCSIRCNKGCSFPGRCGRYTDANGNGICDNTECV